MVPMTAGGPDQTNGEDPFDPSRELLTDADEGPAASLPAPDPNLVAVSMVPPSDDRSSHTMSSAPLLPNAEARAPVPMMGHTPVVGASSWYRTDQQRYKSVYRRANPWYRRLARAVLGLVMLVGLAGLLYLGAQEVQDYLNRDKLPKPGQTAPEFASTSFLVTSSSPAPELVGTITFDTASHAFEFVGGDLGGGVPGPQSGLEVVSPDGSRVYVRESGGDWRQPAEGDDDVAAIMRAVPYLLGVDEADDILENRLRKGYVDLVDEATEGVDPDARERYEMVLDTDDYSADYPLQWQDFEQTVIPGVDEADALPVTMWLDDDHVVVRLRDDQTHWAWERLTYSDERFVPIDPAGVAAPLSPVVPTTAPPG
jgi:hypothetical protein